MSQLLLSELTALSSEAKRKSPDVRTASDAALNALRTDAERLLGAKGEQAATAEQNVLLQPIVLACEGKSATPKVVGIAVGLLQRIIGLRVIRDEDCQMVVELLQHVVATRADVEVHLKVLQAVSSLLSNYASIHFTILSKTLGLCFQLQNSRVGVVSSTAAATLRQAVMTVFDKVRDEDRILDGIKLGGEDAAAAAPLATMTVQLPGSTSVTLFPCSRDTYLILSDLNALANNEHASFLGLDTLSKTFTLELIESVLTNHAHLFRNETHPELLLCLRQATCPLLIKAFNEQPAFPSTLRLIRLLFVLLRQFSEELVVEVEILITILLRFISSPTLADAKRSSSDRLSYEGMPSWQRVLAMEATRSLCSDGVLMRNLWKWFDGKPDSVRVFTQLVDALRNVATENGALIGTADAIHQMNQASSANKAAESPSKERPSGSRRRSSGLYNAAAGVASAAIGGLTSVTDLTSSGGAVGLSQTSVPSVQLIDQLDKSEAPNIPSTYIYLLALQSLVHLAQSLAAFVLPMYSRFVNARPRSAARAPPSLDFDSLSEQDRLEIVNARDMIHQCWAPLLDSFTFFMSSKCDDVLFAEVLTALRNFTNTTGALGLASPRDALIASLTRFAIPRDVMAKLFTIRNRPNATEDIDATLSERNAACLKAVTQIAYYLSGSIGTHWRDILETLCDAEYILRRSGSRTKSNDGDAATVPSSPAEAYKPRPSLASISGLSTIPPGFSSAAAIDAVSGRPFALTQLDNVTLLADVTRVFENTVALGESALTPFLEALCELDADHINLATFSEAGAGNPNATNATSALNRSSPLSSLGMVSMLNVKRIAESTGLEEAWQRVTEHMLAVLSASALRPSLRSQAATSLDGIARAALRSPSDDKVTKVQRQCIDVLARQSILDRKRRTAADIDVRRAGLETFLAVLEAHGHSLQLGWESMFDVFDATCAPASSNDDRSAVPLIKVAFSAMQAICSQLLPKLTFAQLKLCIESLTQFSMQSEEISVALTAGGALWGITAELSSRAERNDEQVQEADLTEMWIHCLINVQKVTHDERLQVRNGAISILFSILEQYGSALSEQVWRANIMNDILLSVLESLHEASIATAADEKVKKEWDESRVLALSSTGKVIRQAFLEKLVDATEVWRRLLLCFKRDFLHGPSTVSQASMRALHHILQVPITNDKSDLIRRAWQDAWTTWSDIGHQFHQSANVFTQANLIAYVETLTPLYAVLGAHLTFDEVSAMLASLKVALTYEKSASERIMDKARLTPLQSAVVARLTTLHMDKPIVASRVLSDLAEYATLAFAGTVESSGKATFIALNRTATEAAVALYEQRANETELYENGAVQQLFAALAIPLKLRYDCPNSTADDALPLWKGSMIALCKVTGECCERLTQLSLSRDVVHGVWTGLTGAFVAALTANCEPILSLKTEEQNDEEAFDVILLATIERHIWPRLGRSEVPHTCIVRLCQALADASLLETVQQEGDEEGVSVSEEDNKDVAYTPEKTVKHFSFVSVQRIPRELFSYWCLDLLVLLCSASDQLNAEDAKSNRRTALWSLSILIRRVQISIAAYVEDARTKGAAPLGRVRDEEINYILSKLSTLRLWPSSLQLALSLQRRNDDQNEDRMDERIKAYVQGAPLAKAAPQTHTTTLSSSPHAHLFHLYPLLCDFLLVVVPREGGRASTMTLATCGSARLYEPVRVPDGFELGSIGKTLSVGEMHAVDNSEPHVDVGEPGRTSPAAVASLPPLADPRGLVRDLLGLVGAAWR